MKVPNTAWIEEATSPCCGRPREETVLAPTRITGNQIRWPLRKSRSNVVDGQGMRRRLLLFALLIALTVVTYRVLGQQANPGLEQRFNRLATNGDVKQTREEAAAQMPFHFTKDYFPGTLDATGKTLIGTEMMSFATHGGKLYAGLGNRNLPENAPVKVGAQIIVKDSEGSPWRVELQFRETAPRVNAMISATFTTDNAGTALKTPVGILTAAPSDSTVVHDHAVSGSYSLRWATAWTRDDASGVWTETRVYSARRRKPACRSFGVYRDPLTKVCHLFAGTSHGSIHRAVYDPAAPGRLVWDSTAELENVGRVVAFAKCNRVLYAACGLRRTREGVTGGLYRRINGPQPRWECVYRWPWPQRRGGADEALLMRGLTAVPAPDGDGEVLLGSRAKPGLIERIDPRSNHAVTVDLDIRDHFAKTWTLPVYNRAALSAYNTITTWTDPRSGKQVHLIGVAVVHPTLATTPPHNGAWYLIRHSAGNYSTGYIYDPAHPLPSGTSLRGTRALHPSPFDSSVIFAGGGDIGKQISLNTAWIYRGTLEASRSKP